MPQTFPNYNPSGTLDGQATSVATIVGPGVTHPGQAIYLANADGTWGDQITGGGGGGQLPVYTDNTGVVSITETGAGDGILITNGGSGSNSGIVITNDVSAAAGIGINIQDNSGEGLTLIEGGTGDAGIEIGVGVAATAGIGVIDQGGGGITIAAQQSASGFIAIQVGDTVDNGITIQDAGGGGIAIEETAAANIGLLMSGTGNIVFDASGAGSGIKVGSSDTQMVGFFGATPILQPAAPVTLGDVITALTNLGLVAS